MTDLDKVREFICLQCSAETDAKTLRSALDALDRLAARVGETDGERILSEEQMLEKLCERASPAVAQAMRLRFSMDRVLPSHLARRELNYERIVAYRPLPPPEPAHE